MGDRLVVKVDDGVTKEEVQTKAAHEAVELLTRERETRAAADEVMMTT